MKSIANKFHLIMLAALSLTACKKDSTVIEIADDDSAIIKVKDNGMEVNLSVNWTNALDKTPDGMTIVFFPTGSDVVSDTIRTYHFDNARSASVTVPEQDYSLICFNLSEREQKDFKFNLESYEKASVTADASAVLDPEALAVASMNSLLDTRGLNVVGVLKPTNVVKSMTLKIKVEGVNERATVTGTLSNMAAGVKMCDRKPLPETIEQPLPPEVWTIAPPDISTLPAELTANFGTFGIFMDDETRAADTRATAENAELRNILHVEITNEDGTVKTLEYDVTEEIIRQYIAAEEEATQQESEPAFKTQLNYSYNKADTTASVISAAAMGDVEIPAYVEHEGLRYKVTTIGAAAFSYNTYMTSITIPETVTTIDDEAFSHCVSLAEIDIPESVTSIGTEAFDYCRSIAEVTIPEGVTSMGAHAFGECKNLTTFNYNAKNCECNTHDRSAFWIYGCTNLQAINIGNSVESIPSYAFALADKGENPISITVTIPESVTSIGNEAFYGVGNVEYHGSLEGAPWGATVVNGVVEDGLILDAEKTQILAYGGNGGDIIIPNSVTSIESSAFSGCTGLKSITIPNSVTSIGSSAFDGCKNLASITIPESVTSIGNYAFYNCTNLASITIPESVTSIGNYAFYGVGNVEYHGSLEGAPWGATAMNGDSFLTRVWEGDFGGWALIHSSDTTYTAMAETSRLKFYSNGTGRMTELFSNEHPIREINYDFEWKESDNQLVLNFGNNYVLILHDTNRDTKTFSGIANSYIIDGNDMTEVFVFRIKDIGEAVTVFNFSWKATDNYVSSSSDSFEWNIYSDLFYKIYGEWGTIFSRFATILYSYSNND